MKKDRCKKVNFMLIWVQICFFSIIFPGKLAHHLKYCVCFMFQYLHTIVFHTRIYKHSIYSHRRDVRFPGKNLAKSSLNSINKKKGSRDHISLHEKNYHLTFQYFRSINLTPNRDKHLTGGPRYLFFHFIHCNIVCQLLITRTGN